MKSILSLLFLASAFAVEILLEKKPDLTANCYRKAEVSISLSQNRFLKLPENAVCSSFGFDPVTVSVPYSIDTYVWELSGFFTPKKMGKHSISVHMAKKASIEIKQRKMSQQVYKQTVPDEYVSIFRNSEEFGRCSVSLNLIEGFHYLFKIVYIARISKVPIYITDPTGIQHDLESLIEEAVYDPRDRSMNSPSKPSSNFVIPSFFQQVGFFSVVYLLPKEITDYEEVIRDYQSLEKIHQGYFKYQYDSIALPSKISPYIREILGHFRAPLDGNYRINLAGSCMAVVQIGPKQLVKTAFYVVSNEWKLLDTRSESTLELELEKSFFYPFRIVSLSDEEKYTLDISVYNSAGKSIDLFGIWKEPVRVKENQRNNDYELFAHAVAPCNCFCQSQKKIKVVVSESTGTVYSESTGTVDSGSTGIIFQASTGINFPESTGATLRESERSEVALTVSPSSFISSSLVESNTEFPTPTKFNPNNDISVNSHAKNTTSNELTGTELA